MVVTAVLYQSINAASSRDNLASSSNYNLSSNNNSNNEGVLIDVQGKQAEWLHAFGLVPAIGDVIVAVDDSVVTQLNSNQLKRLVKRKRTDIRAFLAGRAFVDLENEPTTRITFRRHFLEVKFLFYIDAFVAFLNFIVVTNRQLLPELSSLELVSGRQSVRRRRSGISEGAARRSGDCAGERTARSRTGTCGVLCRDKHNACLASCEATTLASSSPSHCHCLCTCLCSKPHPHRGRAAGFGGWTGVAARSERHAGSSTGATV